MVGGVVSTLMTNFDVGIIEMLELIEELSNVPEVVLKWGKLFRVIGVLSLLLRVGEAVWGLLSGHPALSLDGGELLRAVWVASLLREIALEVGVAMDEVPVAPGEALSIHRRLRSPSSCISLMWYWLGAEQAVPQKQRQGDSYSVHSSTQLKLKVVVICHTEHGAAHSFLHLCTAPRHPTSLLLL